ncbi:MAG: polymerase sigma-70 factor [Gemmatimonadetes bacterium]|nr:polymerase sigma-70 factor [Gemmatimonadota bacterium]
MFATIARVSRCPTPPPTSPLITPPLLVQPSLLGAPPDESNLVARIRAGDEAAFQALYLTHHDGLWRFAYTYVRSRDVAEELVHDVFLALWGTRATWEVRTRARAWLFAAVRHLALNHLRHERVVARALGTAGGAGRSALQRPALDLAHVESSTMGAPPPGQQETAEAHELDEAIGRALAELPERRRIAMTLRWKEDMSPLEIATVLGTTPEAVRVLLTRARADLAALLELARR